MSKPFTYWVRLAMVATMCTLVTFSPVSAGRLMDRLLHRDANRNQTSDCCDRPNYCESGCWVVPSAPCQSAPAAVGCCAMAADPCGCDAGLYVSPTQPAVEAKSVPEAPKVFQPAPVVESPKIAPQKALTPDPVLSTPDPVVSSPAPVVAPTVVAPTVVAEPVPVVLEPTPAVVEPAPVVAEPAPIVEETKDPVENPFGEAPAVKQPATDPFGEAPATTKPADDIFGEAPAPTKPADDIFGEAPAATKPADDIFGDSPTANKPADEPASPTAPKSKTDLDDLFGNDPAPKVPAESDALKQETPVDNLFETEPKANTPAKAPADPSFDDLFNTNEKPAAPASEPPIDELLGKPIATEKDVSREMPNEMPAADGAFIDSLFGGSSRGAMPVDSESAVPDPSIEEQLNLPSDLREPAKTKEPVDELDALFGIGAFTAPSEFMGAEYRQWVDNSGAYQVKGRLAVIYVDKIKLLKENGKFTTVPLSRLSDADFGYVSWVATNLTKENTARMVKTKSQAFNSEVAR